MSDEEWALVAPCLAPPPGDAGRRRHPLRESLDGLRSIAKAGAPWRERPPGTVRGPHLVAFARLMPKQAALALGP